LLFLPWASWRLRPPAKFAGYELLRCSAGVPDAFRDLGAPAKFSWYPAKLGRHPWRPLPRQGSSPGTRPDLVGIPDAFHTSESDHCTAIFEI